MVIIDGVCNNLKNFYNKVEDITTKRPIIAIICAVAITAIAGFLSSFSIFLALGIFSISLFFAVAMVKNIDKICRKIEDNVKEFFANNCQEVARYRGQRAGHYVRDGLESVGSRVQGFCEGIIR